MLRSVARTGTRRCIRRMSSVAADDAQLRRRLLTAALPMVPRHGWTTDALAAAAEECGLAATAHGALPRGPIELVRHFGATCDDELRDELRLRKEEMRPLETHNRLILAIQMRLRKLEPYVETWPQALALRAVPANLAESLSDAEATATILLDACGDEGAQPILPSAALDGPAKKVAIGAVYGAAELYMLTDKSPGFTDTDLFVEKEVNALRTMASTLPLNPAALLMSLLHRR